MSVLPAASVSPSISPPDPFGTLSYTYDNAGDVLSIKSSNTGGISDVYTYDVLNRLSTVTDAAGATTYSYDAVGNLQSFAYPNGVAHTYAYDTLNRLTQVGAAKGTALSSHTYTLGAAGNRLSVAELSGRNVAYGYDSLYRLTSETVTADPHSHNFTNGYAYDAVGNRQQLTVNGVTANTYTYDSDDRLGSDQYDADGNTTNSLGVASSYDFENHLIQKGGVTVVYDGDGNRVAETVGGATTNYLVDTQNPTGYAQVVDELVSGAVTRTYSYGLERISEKQTISGTATTSFYGYDGHGSVRQLTNSTGVVTDAYDYDSFGKLINSTGSTPNNYLFAGEAYDAALGLYYNRARYMNTATGRFWSIDDHEGDDEDPTTLHKYAYTGDDPTDRTDASGNDFDLVSTLTVAAVAVTVMAIAVPSLNQYEQGGSAEPRIATAQSVSGEQFLKYHEGIDGKPNLKPYDNDGSKAGNCTIGWGSKIHDGPCKEQDFNNYANFTVDGAEQLLFQDVETKALFPIKQLVHVGLAQRELDALIDFTFNIGGGNQRTGKGGLASSVLLQQLNARNYKQAGNGFLGWLIPRSILGRRQDEKHLWDTGEYISNGHRIP